MKAAIWAASAGVANIVASAFAPGVSPSWYFLLVAIGYSMLLPVVAVLHVRHQTVRESGAVLATVAATSSVTIGVAASANADLVVAALLVQGVWWWTVGKMWQETGVMPRWLGTATTMLAVIALAGALATAPLGMSTGTLWMYERITLGVWTLALSYALWSTRATAR